MFPPLRLLSQNCSLKLETSHTPVENSFICLWAELSRHGKIMTSWRRLSIRTYAQYMFHLPYTRKCRLKQFVFCRKTIHHSELDLPTQQATARYIPCPVISLRAEQTDFASRGRNRFVIRIRRLMNNQITMVVGHVCLGVAEPLLPWNTIKTTKTARFLPQILPGEKAFCP